MQFAPAAVPTEAKATFVRRRGAAGRSLHPGAPVRALAAPATSGGPLRAAAGKSFARKRIEHAAELAGAAIMLVVFLAVAVLA
ncbi:MAG: hypothetical protein KF830_05825 [Planctomycetes bacterium]|nr:hypothetical protein [Planctomycetota bacterium]